MPDTATIKQLLEAGAHFGHQTGRWHPRMKSYIFTKRNGIHIIDLEKTAVMLDKACAYIREVVAEGGTIGVSYYDFRPYIRDDRRSRPATPDEVKERVWAHPSSEHKRRMEEIKAKQAETLQQMGEDFARQSAERSRMADEALLGRRND